jgi:hypothetical protein
VGRTDRLDPSVLAEPASPALFRAVNERIRELAETWQGTYDFICECPDQRCMRTLRLTEAEYESLRAERDTFAVLPGHERERAEVVARSDRFVLMRIRDEPRDRGTAGKEEER